MSALYQQIANNILEQIATGIFKVGDRLPPEAQLAAQLGISRSTLRLAFSQLESSGVLLRRKRTGTQIIAAEPQPHYQLASASVQDEVNFIRSTPMNIEHIATISSTDEAALAPFSTDNSEWLQIFGSRIVLGPTLRPVCTNRIFVPTRFAGIKHALHPTKMCVISAIEQRYNIKIGRLKSNTKSIRCPDREANILGVQAGAPVLQVENIFYDQRGYMMEVAYSLYHSDHFISTIDVSIE